LEDNIRPVPEFITKFSELNLFETIFDLTEIIILRTLIKQKLLLSDIFPTACYVMCREQLTIKKDRVKF
jgi:hypothetical protein